MKDRTDRLREILRKATDFREPWDYFHDKLVLDPAFMRLGVQEPSQRLESALSLIGARLLGRDVRTEVPVLVHLKEFSFWHGPCVMGEHTAVCFHFEDVDQGLVGIMKDVRKSEVLLARISLLSLPAGTAGLSRGGQA